MARHTGKETAGMIACILLASGFGRRFGSNKLLYEVHGIPMYQHALHMLQALSQQKIDGQRIQIIVVSQYACIEQHAQELGMRAVHNADAAYRRRGRRTGWRFLPPISRSCGRKPCGSF